MIASMLPQMGGTAQTFQVLEPVVQLVANAGCGKTIEEVA